jgi:hypothetical protein
MKYSNTVGRERQLHCGASPHQTPGSKPETRNPKFETNPKFELTQETRKISMIRQFRGPRAPLHDFCSNRLAPTLKTNIIP